MDKLFHPKLYNRCKYLSTLGLKLNHVNKRGPQDGIVWGHVRKVSTNDASATELLPLPETSHQKHNIEYIGSSRLLHQLPQFHYSFSFFRIIKTLIIEYYVQTWQVWRRLSNMNLIQRIVFMIIPKSKLLVISKINQAGISNPSLRSCTIHHELCVLGWHWVIGCEGPLAISKGVTCN